MLEAGSGSTWGDGEAKCGGHTTGCTHSHQDNEMDVKGLVLSVGIKEENETYNMKQFMQTKITCTQNNTSQKYMENTVRDSQHLCGRGGRDGSRQRRMDNWVLIGR